MNSEKKSRIIKYSICFAIAAFIAFVIVWMNGFFTDDVAVNIQILADAFTVSGFLFTAFALMMYISQEGGLIAIGFVIRSVILTFIPMGRARHELYADYRERKLSRAKAQNDRCYIIIGLLFLMAGIILTLIWKRYFYNQP